MAMLRELYRHLFKKRETILYPFKETDKIPLPDGFRGKIAYDKSKCIRCFLCLRNCPSGAIKEDQDEKGKKPMFRMDQCIFCGTCEEVCPVKCIKLTQEYVLVALDRESQVIR